MLENEALTMTFKTLLLTPWMAPSRVISYERAIVLFYLGKVEVVVEYDAYIRSPSIAIRAPAVVRQRRARLAGRVRVSFSRGNVLLRDAFVCQYCGVKKAPHELNIDHVVPRSQGGATSWENAVASCYPCNQRKAGRTPEQAGMKLLRAPARPATLPYHARVRTGSGSMPAEWAGFC